MDHRGHLAVARSLSATMIADTLRGERGSHGRRTVGHGTGGTVARTGALQAHPLAELHPGPVHDVRAGANRAPAVRDARGARGLEAGEPAGAFSSRAQEHRPTGYRIVEYTDSQGYLHRSLVPVAPSPAAPKPPERAQSDEPRPDTTR